MGIKGQGHSQTLARDHSDFKTKTCFFSETAVSFLTKVYITAYGRMVMKTHTNENGQMTKMATVLIFGKKKT